MSETTTLNDWDWQVDKFEDWKVDWVNGGSAQSTWVVTIKMIHERSVPV